MQEFKMKVKKIMWAIRCCITFFPTFMQDNDYDYSSILRLLKKKIDVHRKHIDKHRIATDWHLHVSQMTLAMELIDASLSEDDEEAKKKHDKKWGKPKYISLKVPGEPFYEFRSVRVNVRTDKDGKKERKEYLAIHDKTWKKQQAARKELFKVLYDKLFFWWC